MTHITLSKKKFLTGTKEPSRLAVNLSMKQINEMTWDEMIARINEMTAQNEAVIEQNRIILANAKAEPLTRPEARAR